MKKWSELCRDVLKDLCSTKEHSGLTFAEIVVRIPMVMVSYYNLYRMCDPCISWWARCNYAHNNWIFKYFVRYDSLEKNLAMADLALGELSGDQTEKVLQFQVHTIVVLHSIVTLSSCGMIIHNIIIIFRTSRVSRIYQYAEMFCKGIIGIWRLQFRYCTLHFFYILIYSCRTL